MDRRRFLTQGLMAGGVMLGGGLAWSGCARDLRKQLVKLGRMPSGTLNEREMQILFYASLAPSGHNSQPWQVRVESPGIWVVGSDETRWLPEVDPDNREVLLSIGAFTENLVQAARAFGIDTDVEVLAEGRFDAEVLRIRLKPSAVVDKRASESLERMTARRTIKTGLKPDLFTSEDTGILERAAGGGVYYFKRDSPHARAMADAAVENFRIQFDNEAAMAEAASWTRLSDDEAEKFRDGLTPDGMEIHGLAGFYVRHFMDRREVTGTLWREKAVEKVELQAREGAGWLVITSPSQRVEDLIDAGRRFQRLALAAVPLGIGIHPMTQTLEERHGRETIRVHHDAAMIPQFMLRAGYADPYPAPVSLRRPVDWFLAG